MGQTPPVSPRAGSAWVRNRGMEEGTANCTNALKSLSHWSLLLLAGSAETPLASRVAVLRSHPHMSARHLAAEPERATQQVWSPVFPNVLACIAVTALGPSWLLSGHWAHSRYLTAGTCLSRPRPARVLDTL